MVGQLAGAALSAGASLLSGLFGRSAANKAANKQFTMQDALDHNLYLRNLDLFNHQKDSTNQLNDRVDAFNRDILANYSDNTSYDRNETALTGSIDFDRLVKDSEAAGFNPLSVLRAGGLAGYQNTNQISIAEHRSRAARDIMPYFAMPQIGAIGPGSQAPSVQYTNPFGDAIMAGVNSWLQFDPYAKDRQSMERKIAEAQIRNLDSDTLANNRRFAVPSYTASGAVGSTGGFAGAIAAQGGRKVTVGTPKFTDEMGKVTNALPGTLAPNPYYADVASLAERYGEPAEWAAFPFVAAVDAGYNANRATGGLGHTWGNYVRRGAAEVGGHFQSAYNAMVSAWNNPALNAKGVGHLQ